MKRVSLVFAILAISLVQVALAEVPRLINFQGVLKEATGIDIVEDGEYFATFCIYDSPVNGDLLWCDTMSVTILQGVFNVILGSENPLSLEFDIPYWLGISIQAGDELSPRVALTATPYSFNSDMLDGLDSAAFSPYSHAHALDELSDVATEGAIEGDVLTFAAGDWVASEVDALADADWTIAGIDIYSSQAGNVGIGTTTPSEKLDIVGNAAVSGYVAASIFTSTTLNEAPLSVLSDMHVENLNVDKLDGYEADDFAGSAHEHDLAELGDVDVMEAAEGEVLTYASGMWTSAEASSTGSGSCPIGTVNAWLKSYPNTPDLADGWVECNGQVLDDSSSPYHDQVIPDLNGESRFLRGSSASGATGGVDSYTLTNINPYGSEYTGHFLARWQVEDNKPPYYEVVWVMKVNE